jgi:hypothetical protein
LALKFAGHLFCKKTQNSRQRKDVGTTGGRQIHAKKILKVAKVMPAKGVLA